MSLDAEISRLTKIGTVTVHPNKSISGARIVVEGFNGSGCSCRDVAVMACLWAIGELQREVMRTIEQPGGGDIAID